MKRKSHFGDDALASRHCSKRIRSGPRIQLLDLSDELLLKTVSYLDINDLTRCERVCSKMKGLAQDNEVWKGKYFSQFVRPRARRVPALKSMSHQEQESGALKYSSRRAKWLEHAHLVEAGSATSWKHNFKVKHNWTRGRARTSEVQVGPTPALLAKVHRGFLYTVDSEHGLRVWKQGRIKFTFQLDDEGSASSLDVESQQDTTWVVIGRTSGVIVTYSIEGFELNVKGRYTAASGITSVALARPYVMSLSRTSTVNLLQVSAEDGIRCLTTLHCDAELSPASLSLKKTRSSLVAGIAYAFNRFNSGWCLGLQEVRMDLKGSTVSNRSTSSISNPLRESLVQPQFTSRSATTSPFSLHPDLMRAPNSLSYCGCYILAGLPDNTLMVYTVSSTDDKLEINVGRRLWGHTSAVASAEVTSSGKALSISARSDEMRYWELEDLLVSTSQRKTSTSICSLGVLNEALTRRGDGIGLAAKNVKRETDLVRRCVSFDDEQAIVVGERDHRQIISCFDFA